VARAPLVTGAHHEASAPLEPLRGEVLAGAAPAVAGSPAQAT
jgi:hypothetical protein